MCLVTHAYVPAPSRLTITDIHDAEVVLDVAKAPNALVGALTKGIP